MLNESSRVMVQGITGHQGRFHTQEMIAFGTHVVAGVTPGKGGGCIDSVPVFDSVRDAVRETSPDTSAIFVPAMFAMDALLEAIDNGIGMVHVVTEHMPVHEVIRTLEYARSKSVQILGPNSPGLTRPGVGKLGIMPNMIFKRGDVGIVSRSGTLTYEVVNTLSLSGFGQSICVGIGGDPFIGTSFIDVLKMLEDDESTRSIVLIGEIGGTAEEEAANFIADHISKPVAAYVAGISAPIGKRMGHAGALISGGNGTASSKIAALQKAGARVSTTPSMLSHVLSEMLQ